MSVRETANPAALPSLQPRRSVLDTIIPSRLRKTKPRPKRPNIAEIADAKLDAALERLSLATQENTEVCDRVRTKSSGSLRIVSVPPPPPSGD